MRNKKILALAMAAIVGMTSAPAVYHNVVVAEAAVGDATVKELSIPGGYGSANSGNETVKGDFELVYTFVNATQDSSANWFNFGIEITDGANFISTRADNFGWFFADWNTDGSKMTWGDGTDNWNEFCEVMKNASVRSTIKRKGNTITITNYIVSNSEDNPKEYNFVGTFEMKNLPEEISVHLTGEKVDLYDIKAELMEEATTAPTEEPTTAPTAEPTLAPTEEPTTAPTEEPTTAPTAEPTIEPTVEPTAEPTEKPELKTASITVKNGNKKVSAVTVKKGKSVKLAVSADSKAKITAVKLSKKDAKIAKVTLSGNKLTVKGLKKGKVSVKLTAKKTGSYKAASKTVKVTVK